MIYIASPYTSALVGVQEERFSQALQFTIACAKERLPVYSPIVYWHPLAKLGQLPTDADYWHATNMSFLRKADVVFLLALTGWDQSKGVQTELKVAKILGLPVVKYGPDFKVMQ